MEKVKHFLAHLEEHNLWPDVSKIAMGVADLYEERGDLKESHVFLKRHCMRKIKFSK